MAFLLEQAGHPHGGGDIPEGVNLLDPRSSRATVYNNLRDLVRVGLVREVAVEGRSAAVRRKEQAPSPLHLRPLWQRGVT